MNKINIYHHQSHYLYFFKFLSFSNILPDAWIFMCQAQLFKRKYNVGDSWFQIIPV